MQSLDSLIRHLRLRRGRERRGLALAEGVRLVEEVLAARVPVRAALVAPGLEATPRGAALAAELRRRVERVESISDRALAELAATDHPQGVVAVIEPPQWSFERIVVEPRTVVLVLDAVQDPGNVGTIIRSAWALGAAGVIALPGTAELTNPKVLRATMGAAFRLPSLAAAAEPTLDWCAAHRLELWVAAPDGAAVHTVDRSGPVALVVGNEGAGVGPQLSAAAGRRVAIPQRPGAESLNVGVAAGILLYEALRDS
ncbi:MAG TPA: RNA methyltransferase [Gemmatimonadales bacterium]